ncbi:MAG: hypothetical protein ABS76_06875 [Pelagibacterium sp. SCN 64-44]|nr:MAG: hypothetical protein ABS76_06875 [Pelagibacterium sp. SCN 64-44]
MKRALAILALLALAAQPALAQKTKTAPADAAVAALEVCETFARGDVLAVEEAVAAGWDAYDQESESPFVRSYAGGRELPGIGWADLFVLVETYPDRVLGYCRIDVADTNAKGDRVVEALTGLDRYAGETFKDAHGAYASLSGTGAEDSLLITHWDDIGFVIQLTILTPKAGE